MVWLSDFGVITHEDSVGFVVKNFLPDSLAIIAVMPIPKIYISVRKKKVINSFIFSGIKRRVFIMPEGYGNRA